MHSSTEEHRRGSQKQKGDHRSTEEYRGAHWNMRRSQGHRGRHRNIQEQRGTQRSTQGSAQECTQEHSRVHRNAQRSPCSLFPGPMWPTSRRWSHPRHSTTDNHCLPLPRIPVLRTNLGQETLSKTHDSILKSLLSPGS